MAPPRKSSIIEEKKIYQKITRIECQRFSYKRKKKQMKSLVISVNYLSKNNYSLINILC